MSKISLELIKKIKSRTDAGTVDCKKALEETEGDLDRALQLLAQRGATILEISRFEKRRKIARTDADVKADIARYVRVPIKIEELFIVPESILEEHQLYVTREVGEKNFMDKGVIVYLDDIVGVDDETDKEIYPTFALNNNLEMNLLGKLVNDIIYNTKHQLKNPTANDFIKNFNNYMKHDCFLDF
jgi:elongation factor Ts